MVKVTDDDVPVHVGEVNVPTSVVIALLPSLDPKVMVMDVILPEVDSTVK